MSNLRITVCGVGNAGMAIAADLSMMGFDVSVYEVSEFSAGLQAIRENNGITLTGQSISGKTGLARLNKITDDAEEALQDADLIMVTVPAPAHQNIMEKILPFLREGQNILFNTGYWSSIRFNELLRERDLLGKVTIIESNIMPYLSGRVGPAHAHIYNYKSRWQISTWPASKNQEAYELMKKIYPQCKLSNNIIETNFYPGNLSIHAQIVIPKAEFFFERAREFRFYNEVSLSASKLAEAFDLERLNVVHAYECESITFLDWVRETYRFVGENLQELYANSENGKRWGHIQGIYRVLEEDICYSLIPMEQFADVVGVKVPITTAMIEILQVFTGVDYRSKAITLKELGFDGMNKEEIMEYITHGTEVFN